MGELTITRELTAAGCNAQMELPLQSLVREIIDAATEHANSLGFGYARLIEDGNAWVLSRLSIEMSRFPAVGENYSLTTWIESFNRHFSERNFEICTEKGEILGYARTIWVAINIATRRPADLTAFTELAESVSDKVCPIPPQSKTKIPAEFENSCGYTVVVSDIDSNRHLTTARYVELVVDCLPLKVYDNYSVHKFDISFTRECTFSEKLTIAYTFKDNCLIAVISGEDGKPSCTAKMEMKARI